MRGRRLVGGEWLGGHVHHVSGLVLTKCQQRGRREPTHDAPVRRVVHRRAGAGVQQRHRRVVHQLLMLHQTHAVHRLEAAHLTAVADRRRRRGGRGLEVSVDVELRVDLDVLVVEIDAAEALVAVGADGGQRRARVLGAVVLCQRRLVGAAARASAALERVLRRVVRQVVLQYSNHTKLCQVR